MSASTSSDYAHALANLKDTSAEEERVEVNQRALIDKILARYASANAVYRELIQNSNDAEATVAEIYFTTSAEKESDIVMDVPSSAGKNNSKNKLLGREIVRQVEYRNNGMPFRPQDWSRLKKIAEGNPDESKIGAFGVGAYTMFSVCEEPLVLSGTSALAFVWKGDALYTRTIAHYDSGRSKQDQKWTSFVLPSRDPYSLPNLQTFGEFLCSSLTFTKCLKEIRVYVNKKKRMTIHKTLIQEPIPVKIQKNSNWWKSDGAVLTSPSGLFTLMDEQSLLESIYHIQVDLDGEIGSVTARYLSAVAKTKIPPTMVNRMERVMKKKPPSKIEVQLFLSNQMVDESPSHSKRAYRIIQSFLPSNEGKIFIGFRTSQTTGVSAHLCAPFLPTVEREQVDTQDPTLRLFNLELLHFAGITARLALENGMKELGVQYQKGAEQRKQLEEKLLREAKKKGKRNGTMELDSQSRSNDDTEIEEDTSVTGASATSSSSLFGFAKFMAKGVKRTIKTVVSNVSDILIEDGGELIHPIDPRPLCGEEHQAILLMQAFCPRQSTPDPIIGTAFAQGFSDCLQNQAPPVLTRSGVLPGNQGYLPNMGIEAFVEDQVIRSIVYENAREYHDVVAQCRKLNLDDMRKALTDKVLEEAMVVRLIKWWVKYNRINPRTPSYQGLELKEAVKYFPDGQNENAETHSVFHLKDFLFYVDKNKLPVGSGYTTDDLPMPPTVLAMSIHHQVDDRILSEESLRVWFSPLPVEMWVDFISNHPCIVSGQPEFDRLRLHVLSTVALEYNKRSAREKQALASYCEGLLRDKRCIPFDSSEPSPYAADIPSNLYLSSAELKTFDGMGNFHKVSHSLKRIGIADEFLVQLGVRESVAVEFLFANSDHFKWSNDPRPLIEYLRTAKLTRRDVEKLTSTQYLPSETDPSQMFAPSELYLPDPSLRVFPFVRLLQWPTDDDVTERSLNGKFLVSVGMNVLPPLYQVLKFISDEVKDDAIRLQCIDFVAKKLGPNGPYQSEYARISRSDKANLRYLPCVIKSPLSGEEKSCCYSSLSCCSERKVAVLGFPVLNLGSKTKVYGNLFQCAEEPDSTAAIQQMKLLVSMSKKMLNAASRERKQLFSGTVLSSFAAIFEYLSTRNISAALLSDLSNEKFIPCLIDNNIVWCTPSMVFFKGDRSNERCDLDMITESLFPSVPFSPFLSSAGVKQEASTKDLFQLMLHSPESVFAAVKSEKRYCALLRRIAAHRPFQRVTPEIRNSPFLLAYVITEGEDGKENTRYELAKAADIYVIDNTFFGRMFRVKRAPHESDLEDFYALIGSPYISKMVEKKFDVVGMPQETVVTDALMKRIEERGPLLLSPSVTSRPLIKNASSVFDPKNFSIVQVPELKVVYSLGKSTRTNRTTCCNRPGKSPSRNTLIITPDFEMFDVGFAVGELILQRCQLEDAFFISSLLEAPLDQLRARGFPVDRIIKPIEVLDTRIEEDKSGSSENANVEVVASVPQSIGEENSSLPPAGDTGKNDAMAQSSKQKEEYKAAENQSPRDAYASMLKEMYPGAEDSYIKEKLGDRPDLNRLKEVAEDLAINGYPDDENSTADNSSATGSVETNASKILGSKKLGRAFNGLKGSNFGGVANRLKKSGINSMGGGGMMSSPPSNDRNKEVRPKDDPILHENMESMLKETVKASPSVDASGLKSPEQSLSIPEGLDHGSSCEVIPSQNIKPCVEQNGKAAAHNGIKIFSHAKLASSEEFLRVHRDAVECFAVVLERLCTLVFGLSLRSVAIYHDPTGAAIAFNAGGALYFNFRYFHSLHFLKNLNDSKECYSYWYVVGCHELAHNLVKAHDRNHGFYTESYTILFLPKLMDLLSGFSS
ncbi:DUF3684 domain containing protein [Nitzschia inconspicua]|uniref:DUF3684 domain containing protein n=1 Tax=Nitzschia inconspicua TaxID=303405 RepID=A0A9K3PDU6_9STRA|nr:DUF3684 domain containing protein [Nitzschia inconspicua]